MANGARTLVLGGGGVTGVAWEFGIIAGLASGGIDLREADLVVGTSAGSVVGAFVANGTDPQVAYQSQLAARTSEIPAKLKVTTIARLVWIVLRSRSGRTARQRIGRLALRAKTISEADRRTVIAERIPLVEWPQRRLLVTAVDTGSGEFHAFDRESGVSLIDAVGASCAVPGVWPPVTIGDRRYMDGGMKSPANVDLAAGSEQLVVIAPIIGGLGPRGGVVQQVVALGDGVKNIVIAPDRQSRQAIGRNVLDPSRRPPSARAGYAQGQSLVDAVKAVWS